MTDADLLRRYAEDASDAAFAELVERHLNFVYSVARRHLRSPALAEDVAQTVFIELTRHARRIKPGTPLVAWLHLVSRRIALNAIRGEIRRHARETAAAELGTMKPTTSTWADVEPLLDEAIETLDPADRSAILLRFFEDKNLREVGVVLGTSEDTAQKRVTRAVEQLRTFFLRRGVVVTAAGLTTDLSAHALLIAPAGLSATISTVAALSGAAGSVAALAATKTAVMTTLQKTLFAAAFALVAGAGLYEVTVAARQRTGIVQAQAQVDALTTQLSGLSEAEAAAARRLAAADAAIDARVARSAPSRLPDSTLESLLRTRLARLDRLKSALEQNPALAIPELQLLPYETWVAIAMDSKLDTADDVRHSLARLRQMAENTLAGRLTGALRAYVAANNGMLPNNPVDLATFIYPAVDSVLFSRYEMRQTGRLDDLPRPSRRVLLATRAPIDAELDSILEVSTNSYGMQRALARDANLAQLAFGAAHSGQRASDAASLAPYLPWPVAETALTDFLRAHPAAAK